MNNKKRGVNSSRFPCKMEKRGQVWIETVVYTLIAFVLIAAVLTFARPKIEELKDKAVVEQTISMLKDLDDTILTLGIPGNQRVVTLGIDKGTLKIDGENDKLVFELDSNYAYGEEAEDISEDGLVIRTDKKNDENHITITRDYSGEYNLTFENLDKLKTITSSPTSYNLIILKGAAGEGEGSLPVVGFNLN